MLILFPDRLVLEDSFLIRGSPFLPTMTIFPLTSSFSISGMDRVQKLSILIGLCTSILILQFTVKLYHARMKFRKLQARGIVCHPSHHTSRHLMPSAITAPFPDIGPLSCGNPILQGLGLRCKLHPDLWFLHQ